MSTNNPGFTLVEILVVMGIISVICAGAFSVSSVSYIDPLETEYDTFVALLYKTREQSVQNPGVEFEVDIEAFAKDSKVAVHVDVQPVFDFGELHPKSHIDFLYADRTREITISELGAIDH